MSKLNDCRAALLDPNVQAFLRVIRAGESSQDVTAYWWLYGSTVAKPILATGLADHPRVKTYEKYDGQFIKNGELDYTTAAGAYQIVASTWDSTIQTALRLPDFSPESQDLAAVYLLLFRKALDHVLAGRFEQACIACRQEWVSMPGANVGDQPTKSAASALAVFRKYGGKLSHELVAAPAPAPDYQAKEDAMAGNPVEYPQPEEKVMPSFNEVLQNPLTKFALAAFNPILGAVPEIARIFMDKGTPVPERNVAATLRLVETAQKAIQAAGIDAPNAQAVAEAVESNPTAREAVRSAVLADPFWHMVEAGGGGVEGARKASLAYAMPDGPRFWLNPSFWISIILILMPFMLLVDVLFVHPEAYVGELRTQIVTGVLMVIGMVGGYWIGTSISSARKDDRAAQ